MTTSVSLTCTPDEAVDLVARLEASFGDDGYPVDELLLDEGRKRRIEVLFWDREPDEAYGDVSQVLGDIDPNRLIASRLGDVDWVAKSLEGLAPVWASRIVVHGQHDRHRISSTALAIEIEAALAFGSGHHGSTVGCLLALQRVIKRTDTRRMLDLGTGTGVLAIALAKLTHKSVVASDIDPVATLTAKQNAALNNVSPLVRCVTANGPHHAVLRAASPFDLIVANILARPLEKMATSVSSLAASRATLVLSGLRPTDRARILSAYGRHGFRLNHAERIDDWLTLILQRQPN